jgi:phosphoglycerate kinase
MNNFRTLYDLDFHGKRVLVRVDFNVPLDEHADVANDKRIRETLPTIRYLRSQGAKLILITHVGRPQGKRVIELQTDGIAHRLSQLLGTYVPKLHECIGPTVTTHVANMKEGDVVMLENVRFYPEEKSKNNAFARQLSTLADFFVLDAFGVSHRKQASITQVSKFIPSCAGFLLQKELEALGKVVDHGKQPFVTVIGGAKADKIAVIKNLLPAMDHLLIGGKLANTFLKAAGKDIGASAFDYDTVPVAERLLYEAHGKLVLPVDVVVANQFDKDAETKVVSVDAIPADWMGIDIGPETRKKYEDILAVAETIVWCGPIGVFEIEQFSHGTRHVATIVAKSNALKIIGGGDSAAAVEKFDVAHYMTHVSTGGGASLEVLQGTLLPGVKALEENKELFPELLVH